MKLYLFLLPLLSILSCSKNNDGIEPGPITPPVESMFFPSNTGSTWETKSMDSLGWNQSAVQSLRDYLIAKNSKSFMILVNGRIVMEEYFDGHTSSETWQWNSAGKTLVSATTGIAQQEGLLSISDKVTQYLGKWNKEQIINEAFFNQSITTSQDINPSYGYFWWLNGKPTYMVPGGQTVYPGFLVPNAPSDMYAAMGAEDNRIYVIPSKKMVVIRMGKASDPGNASFALSGFDNELWAKINSVIN